MIKITLNSESGNITPTQPIWKNLALLIIGCFLFAGCSSDSGNTQTENQAGHDKDITLAEDTTPENDGKGIGPVKSVDVAGFDATLANKGKSIFEGKCTACHQLSEQKIVGPGLKGVTKKRKPEWIMNMIVNPDEMTQKDPEAKKLLAEHLTQMTNQDVSEQDARAILEFLRQNDGAN